MPIYGIKLLKMPISVYPEKANLGCSGAAPDPSYDGLVGGRVAGMHRVSMVVDQAAGDNDDPNNEIVIAKFL